MGDETKEKQGSEKHETWNTQVEERIIIQKGHSVGFLGS